MINFRTNYSNSMNKNNAQPVNFKSRKDLNTTIKMMSEALMTPEFEMKNRKSFGKELNALYERIKAKLGKTTTNAGSQELSNGEIVFMKDKNGVECALRKQEWEGSSVYIEYKDGATNESVGLQGKYDVSSKSPVGGGQGLFLTRRAERP